MSKGLILHGIGSFYRVESDNRFYECKLRGNFRKRGITPLPGDFVDFVITNEARKEGWIDEVQDRENSFIRPPVANINRIAIVITAKSPEPDLLLVDKLLITANRNEIEPVLILNKLDLVENHELAKIKAIYAAAGYAFIAMSKITMEGYDLLHEWLKGCRTVFAGQSGVGKSTILNNIMDSWVMETGEISSRIQRGRHTTRHVQLLPLDCGGYVVDTPGFSSFSLEGVRHDELAWSYPEFEPYQDKCRFHGCSHINEPDCGVKNAVESGNIHKARYECYKKLFEGLKEQYDNRYR